MRLTHRLSEAFRDAMPHETILLTRSDGEGRRLLKSVADAGQPLFGVRALSPMALAREITAEYLSQPGAPKLLEAGQAQDLMFRLLTTMPATGFFASPRARDRVTARLMLQQINELNMYCAEKTGGNSRLDAVQTLREAWTEAKGAEFIDTADLLGLAIKLAPEYFKRFPCRFVRIDGIRFEPLEERLITACAGNGLVTVSSDGFDVLPTLRFAACRGKETGQRFILRDILKRGLKAEDCAVICLEADDARGLCAEAAHLGIPVSVASGVPLTDSPLYFALNALAGWAGTDFDAEALRRLILGGEIRLPRKQAFLDRLRAKRVGWSLDRYYDLLLKVSPDEKYPPDDETVSAWKKFIGSASAIALRNGGLEQTKVCLYDFIRSYAPDATRRDACAIPAFNGLLDGITWLDGGENTLDRLLECAQAAAFTESADKPGTLYITSLSDALCTGRKTLYFCGMSRFCMQGSRTPSPLMLDEEREKYGLPTPADREAENTRLMYQALYLHEGDAVCSYCDYDPEGMTDLEPAPIYNALKGNTAAEKYTYIPETCLTLGDAVAQGRCAVTPPVPASDPGEGEALTLREEQSYAEQLDSRAFSPTELETALECPLQFYLKRMLGLWPAELPEHNRDRWLDPAHMGSLCHEVLEKYFRDTSLDADTLIGEVVERFKLECPPSSEYALRRDIQRARSLIGNAIKWTNDNGRDVHSTEHKFGKNAGETPLDIRIGGRAIGVSGSIDRVDRTGDTFAVIDYKTGTAKKYKEHGDIKLQPYLYARAFEQLCPGVQVSQSGYLFLTGPVEYLPAAQDADARRVKENLILSLLERMRDEQSMLTPAPAFTFDESGAIKDLGDDKARAKEYGDCSKYCQFAAMCTFGRNKEAAEHE